MNNSQIIDLSHTLQTGMPVYPGSPEVKIVREAHITREGYNEMHIDMTTHTGTHIDCGYHLLENGSNTESTPVSQFMGRGVVIDCRSLSTMRINMQFLQTHEDKLKSTDFVLFNTGWSQYWGKSEYFTGFPTPDPEAAKYLTWFGLKGTGTDAISFDPADSHDLPVHNILLSQGMILIENLDNLSALPDQGFTFCCFPLKFRDGDGSPVRAVGVVGSRE